MSRGGERMRGVLIVALLTLVVQESLGYKVPQRICPAGEEHIVKEELRCYITSL